MTGAVKIAAVIFEQHCTSPCISMSDWYSDWYGSHYENDMHHIGTYYNGFSG